MTPGIEAEWEELRRLATKHRESNDPDIAKALEAALISKAQSIGLIAKTKPAWLEEFPLLAGMFTALEPDLPDPTDGSTPPDPPGEDLPNDVEAAERFIRESRIFSMRGDKAKAKDLLDQAEKAAPRSGAVLVALGDAALERHNLKEAVRLYTLARETEPTNVAIEKKHADAIFRQMQGTVFDPTARSDFEAVASAKSAVLLSALFPGVGQIVTGDVGKGIFFILMVAGGWITSLLIGFKGLFAVLGMGASKDANMIVILPLGLAILFHLMAILDASAKAKTMGKRRAPDRPVPPANLPFE